MKDTKPVKDQKYNADGAVVDPEGTVYFTASSASGKNRIEEYNYEWLDFSYISEEPTYSTIEFTKNSFTLKTYGVDSKKQIDECKIRLILPSIPTTRAWTQTCYSAISASGML